MRFFADNLAASRASDSQATSSELTAVWSETRKLMMIRPSAHAPLCRLLLLQRHRRAHQHDGKVEWAAARNNSNAISRGAGRITADSWFSGELEFAPTKH